VSGAASHARLPVFVPMWPGAGAAAGMAEIDKQFRNEPPASRSLPGISPSR
jgi:hypothetical protein